MARTYGERLIEQTCRKLRADGKLRFWHRFAPMRYGERNQFNTPAPLDFMLCTEAGHYYVIECKDRAGTLGMSTVSDEQQRLLSELPNARLFLRLYSGTKGLTRRSRLYWERMYLLTGEFAVSRRTHSVRSLQGWSASLASEDRGVALTHGLNRNGKPADGLTEFCPT